MKLLILYRPRSEFARSVEEFVNNLERVRPDSKVVLMDVDSADGVNTAELYDIMQTPAVLALSSDGTLLNSWLGEHLPLIDDVVGWLH